MIGTAMASSTGTTADTVNFAHHIPAFQRREMAALARTELTRFLALLDSLTADDWTQPTDCTAWDVRAIVAHQASHQKAASSVREFFDQFSSSKLKDYTTRGYNQLDASNQRQVDLRVQKTTSELISEIRTYAEPSIQKRQRFPFFIRLIRVPVPGYQAKVSIADLLDVIFTRDMWMHRHDIAQATQREFVRTADHDGRMVELIVRELDHSLSRVLSGKSVIYHLTGTAGGSWQLGGNGTPEVAITLDVMAFNRLASGRLSVEQALQTKTISIDGDTVLGKQALQGTTVLY